MQFFFDSQCRTACPPGSARTRWRSSHCSLTPKLDLGERSQNREETEQKEGEGTEVEGRESGRELGVEGRDKVLLQAALLIIGHVHCIETNCDFLLGSPT